MKKVLDIVITLCALVAGVGFLLFGGPSFIKARQGATPLEAGETFAQAEGKYISYEAAYPVASWAAEYYSGDQDRVKRVGYVVYDKERQAFVSIIVSAEDKGRYSNLMNALELRAKLRADKDMSPAYAYGSPEPMDKDALEAPLEALAGSQILRLYDMYGGADGNRNRSEYEEHFGDVDEYGKVLEEMCIALEQGKEIEWYSIEDGCINGFGMMELWIIMLAAVLSLLIFVFRLVSMLKGEKEEPYKTSASGGRLGRVVDAQWGWVADWCDYSMNRGRRFAYMSVAGGVLILTAIGVLVGMPLRGILSLHLPLGLFLGELSALMFWFSQKKRSNPDKILASITKSLEKQLPSPAEQDEFAEDFLNTGTTEWIFREQCKDTMLYGVVGSRYWAVFSGLGTVKIIDSERLQKIETEEISGSIKVNGVRTRYHSWEVRFYYRSDVLKKHYDELLSFQTGDGIGLFLTLVRKRTGGSIEVTSL